MQWIDDLKAEQEQETRAEIFKMVQRHARESGQRHRHIWHKVYDTFEQDTNLVLPHDGKIDWLTAEGHLPTLFKIAAKILAPKLW